MNPVFHFNVVCQLGVNEVHDIVRYFIFLQLFACVHACVLTQDRVREGWICN